MLHVPVVSHEATSKFDLFSSDPLCPRIIIIIYYYYYYYCYYYYYYYYYYY